MKDYKDKDLVRWLKTYQHPIFLFNIVFGGYDLSRHYELSNMFYQDKKKFLNEMNKYPNRKDRLIEYYKFKIRE